jgi:hypothetical protein
MRRLGMPLRRQVRRSVMRRRGGADRPGRGKKDDDAPGLRARPEAQTPGQVRRPFVEPALVRHESLTRVTLVSDFGGGGSGSGSGGTFF